MITVNYVNLIQISLLTVALLGVVLLGREPRFRYIVVLFLLVIVASVFNLLEELGVTRQIHLVTPVFILGFGPAIYLALKQLLGEPVTQRHWLHFLPMLLALPFTQHTDSVILLGTVWRVVYAGLTLSLMYGFSVAVINWRSDAIELSFKWLGLMVAVMTLVSVLNLVRLNFQTELGHHWNVMGQGISTGISWLFLVFLLHQLVHKKAAILDLVGGSRPPDDGTMDTTNTPDRAQSDEQVQLFEPIYRHLLSELAAKQWFTQPRLTLQQLSDLSGLQSRDISRAINLHARCNFNDFINQQRLDHVINRMQAEPNKPLLNLAIEAGFNAKTTFNAVFKKHQGMTPSTYRAKLDTENI